MKRIVYKKTLPEEMCAYFLGYDEGGAPSFRKFAGLIGTTLAELSELREHAAFDAAWRECIEIRRDYLIDRALTKKFDPTFVKFLVTDEPDGDGGRVEIKLEVVE